MVIENKKRHYLNVGIVCGLMLGFGYLPAIEPVTPLGMRVLGVLLGCLYGWLRGSMIWPSLLGLIMIGFVTNTKVNEALATGFSNETVLIILTSYLFCGGLQKSNLMDTVSKLILKRKFAKASPWMLALALYMTAAIGGILVGSTISCLLVWSLFSNIVDIIETDRKSRYVQIVTCGIAVMAYSGNLMLPWNVCILVSSAIMSAVVPGFQLNFLDYTIIAAIITIIAIPALTLLGKILCPKVDYTIPEEFIKGNIKMDMSQIVAFVCVLFVFIVLFAPNFVQETSLISKFSNTLGVSGVLILVSIIMELVVVGREGICSIDYSFKHYLNWGTVFLVMAALVIAGYLTSDGTGISALLKNVLYPVFEGKSLLFFLILLCIICTVATNCLNNAVMMTLLIPIGAIFAPIYGISNQYLVTIMAILLTFGLMLPSGSIIGSLLHAQDNLITSSQAMKYCFIMTFLYCVIVIILSLIVCTLGIM